MNYDLRAASIGDLAAFVFDHEVVDRTEDDTSQEWFWTDDFTVEFDAIHQIQVAGRLFESSADLRWKYSEEQIEQGVWFMFGPGGDRWFARLLRDTQLPVRARQRFIEALYDLYAGLLSTVALETATFMLWDLLIDQFYNGHAGDVAVPPDLAAVMFATLARILTLPDPECQRAALHGLGHLRHAQTHSLVSEYLARNRELPETLKAYAGRVRDGQDVL